MNAARRSGYHHQRVQRCGLTDVERQILNYYARGMNRSQIGARVGLSERTVSHYLTIAKEKLGANPLVQATVWAPLALFLSPHRSSARRMLRGGRSEFTRRASRKDSRAVALRDCRHP
jgi:DNA-binding CsgD family transcriptional regulator